ncbi:hypothetical protein ACIREE_21295 [Streptomyces sp. NPDC102467]|uniref:hypothetical protein n=1 Tax=Streptomyces sp. NPDC102467 TaxID=3366179 RepID=UPI00380F9F51
MLRQVVGRGAVLGDDDTAAVTVEERKHIHPESAVQDGLDASQPTAYRHRAFGWRGVEAQREDEGGAFEAELVEQHMAGRDHAVEQAAYQ